MEFFVKKCSFFRPSSLYDQLSVLKPRPGPWSDFEEASFARWSVWWTADIRASDFPRSRKSRGIRGIADVKRNPFFFFFFNVSHMAFSSALSFLLSTHSLDCAVPLLLSIHMLIVHFFFRSPR